MITPLPLQPDIQLTLDAAGVIRDATLSNDMAGESVEALLGRLWLETISVSFISGASDGLKC